MSKRISKQKKKEVLDHYIQKPTSNEHPEILRAIKTDVTNAKTNSNDEITPLYNQCMGVYRAFLKEQRVVLELKGKKANTYKSSMLNLIDWMKALASSSNYKASDNNILGLFKRLFEKWDHIDDFYRKQISLPEIEKNIEVIVSQIRSKDDSKTVVSKGFGQL